MTRDEAKAILQVWRPGGEDAEDPRFAEALKALEQDTELARWFAEQKGFDSAMAAQVQTIQVPRDLKASILAQKPVVRVPFWQRDLLPLFQRPAPRWALAACVAGLLVAGSWATMRSTSHFADYRREITDEAWDANPHVELRTSDLKTIKQWLAERGMRTKLVIPSALRDMNILGCRILKWRGHQVVSLCLSDGVRHNHLFVTDQIEFANRPWEHLPDYENCGRWKTAAWSHGDRTYLLVGMKYSKFTKRFYRDRQWLMSI
jgi:hypothetical protein